MGYSEIGSSSWGYGAPFQETLRTILNLELLYVLCHPSEILHLPCCPTCHLYAHCLFPSYFRKTFPPQWWKHITMKWAAMDNLLSPLFRKEITMFQDLFVLYPLLFLFLPSFFFKTFNCTWEPWNLILIHKALFLHRSLIILHFLKEIVYVLEVYTNMLVL